jgi:hypothetical protein
MAAVQFAGSLPTNTLSASISPPLPADALRRTSDVSPGRVEALLLTEPEDKVRPTSALLSLETVVFLE